MDEIIEALERYLMKVRKNLFGLSQTELSKVYEEIPLYFHDVENLKAILAKSSKKDVRNFQLFVQSLRDESIPITYRVYLMRYYEDSKEHCQRGGETILRILKLLKFMKIRNSMDNEFHLGCLRILDADSIDEFEALSPDIQRQVWGTYYTSRSLATAKSCDDLAYLKLLKMTGMDVVSNGSYEVSPKDCMMAFRLKHQENARKNKPQIELDLSDPTEDFVVEIIDELRDVDWANRTGRALSLSQGVGMNVLGLKTYGYQIILLLRAVYGEAKVREVISMFTNASVIPHSDEVLKVLSEWDNLKGYPLAWIKNIAGLRH